jgi:hypothetical protein
MTKNTNGKWKDIAPMKTRDRLQMDKKAPWCFLDHSDPDRPKYPICPKNSVTPTKQGIDAALHRARMQNNTTIIKKALEMQEKTKFSIKRDKKVTIKKEDIQKKQPTKVKKETINKKTSVKNEFEKPVKTEFTRITRSSTRNTK